jgi:hypothetical protein
MAFEAVCAHGAVRTEHRKSVVNFFNTASSSLHCRRLLGLVEVYRVLVARGDLRDLRLARAKRGL